MLEFSPSGVEYYNQQWVETLSLCGTICNFGYSSHVVCSQSDRSHLWTSAKHYSFSECEYEIRNKFCTKRVKDNVGYGAHLTIQVAYEMDYLPNWLNFKLKIVLNIHSFVRSSAFEFRGSEHNTEKNTTLVLVRKLYELYGSCRGICSVILALSRLRCHLKMDVAMAYFTD